VLQSTVAQAIAGEIRVQVKPQDVAYLKTAHPLNRKAFEAYLAGRDHLVRASEFTNGSEQEYLRETDNAVGLFRQAIQEDPTYIPAYLGIYDVIGLGGFVPRMDLVPAARAAVSKALELDDSLVEGHLNMARLLMQIDYDYTAAGREYQRALELAPDSSQVHLAYAEYPQDIGREADADRETKVVQEMDSTHFSGEAEVFYEDRTIEEKRESLDAGHLADDGFLSGALGVQFLALGRH